MVLLIDVVVVINMFLDKCVLYILFIWSRLSKFEIIYSYLFLFSPEP